MRSRVRRIKRWKRWRPTSDSKKVVTFKTALGRRGRGATGGKKSPPLLSQAGGGPRKLIKLAKRGTGGFLLTVQKIYRRGTTQKVELNFWERKELLVWTSPRDEEKISVEHQMQNLVRMGENRNGAALKGVARRVSRDPSGTRSEEGGVGLRLQSAQRRPTRQI